MNKAAVKDKRITIDMMHYKSNRASFWLILLAIALNIAMFIIIYKTNTSSLAADLQLGFDLLINVIFMLTCFLAAEKTKRYSKFWGYASIVLGAIQVARIFWIPLYYYLNGGINVGSFTACVVLQICGAAALIFAGIIALIKYKVLQLNKPMLVQGEMKKTDDGMVIAQTSTITNAKYTKKNSNDPDFDEYVVTFIYQGYELPYFMFIPKKEKASIADAKKRFATLIASGELEKYAYTILKKYREIFEVDKPVITQEGAKNNG